MTARLPVYPPLPALAGDCAGCPEHCCGPAICSPVEMDRIRAFVAEHGIVPRRQGIDCPVRLDGRCAIYEVRPAVCRLYGHVEELPCSQGFDVRATRAQRRPYDVAIAKIRRRGDQRFVHELAYTPEETARLTLAHFARVTEGSAVR